MASQGLQILGVLLSFIGWLGTIIACAMPMWRVTAFIGPNNVTAQVIWEGLWMNCVVQSTGQMQCKVYESIPALPQDLQAARAMVIISIIIGTFGVLMAIVGGKSFLIMIPVSWSAHVLIRSLLQPHIEEGAGSVAVHWVANCSAGELKVQQTAESEVWNSVIGHYRYLQQSLPRSVKHSPSLLCWDRNLQSGSGLNWTRPDGETTVDPECPLLRRRLHPAKNEMYLHWDKSNQHLSSRDPGTS
ncbi:hypothetical protein WMY93_030905 [Mugilogobius chulae]|uniref:Claudin n=1 Tax=Mugilogobius chulae TaxID=88201 RepID=A0AAW0MG70_9GOBI